MRSTAKKGIIFLATGFFQIVMSLISISAIKWRTVRGWFITTVRSFLIHFVMKINWPWTTRKTFLPDRNTKNVSFFLFSINRITLFEKSFVQAICVYRHVFIILKTFPSITKKKFAIRKWDVEKNPTWIYSSFFWQPGRTYLQRWFHAEVCRSRDMSFMKTWPRKKLLSRRR